VLPVPIITISIIDERLKVEASLHNFICLLPKLLSYAFDHLPCNPNIVFHAKFMRQQIAISYIRTKFKLLSALSKRKAAQKAFQLFCTPQYRNKKKLPPIFEKAEKLHFSFAGDKIKGYRWNHPADKKLLILHGYESSVVNFDRFIKPLTKAGFEVLAFDAPAHGRSSGTQINAVAYKNFVLHINKEYGPVTNFITHSFGGLALSLAIEEIEEDEKNNIVFIAPAAETTTAINSFFKFLKLDKEVRKEFDQIIFAMSGYPPEWFSIGRIAKNIKGKVLWLQDKDDLMTPLSDVEPIMAKNYPNFQFIISEGLGHRRIYRDNNSFREIMKFFDAYDDFPEHPKKIK
jgi:pimeloyl-ACP methyl ester carboxylesterase